MVDEFRTSSDSAAIGVSLSSIASMTQEIKPNRAFSDPRLGCIPTMRIAEEEAMSEKIREVAQMVGVERFYLTVGNVLRRKGALVGLKPDGVVTRNEAERIQAKEVLEEQVREAETHKKHVFNPAVGEFVAMMGQIDEFRQLRNKIQLEGMVAKKSGEERKRTDREVTEFLDEPEVKQAAAKLKTAGKKLLESSGKMRQLEAENPALGVQASDASQKLQGVPQVEETSGAHSQIQTHATPEGETAAEMEQLFAWSRARHEFEQQRNEVMEQMAVLNEKLDRFAEAHPTIAKYSDKIIEGIGTLAMGIALFAGPEITAATILTNGATLLTYGKLFDVLINGGSEKFIDYCALQGRTEAESVRYGTAAAGIVNKLLMFSVIKGGLKVVKGKTGSAKTISVSEATTISKEIFRRKTINAAELTTAVAEGIEAVIRQTPEMARGKTYILSRRVRSETGPGKTEPLLQRGEKPSERPTWKQSEIDDILRTRKAGLTSEPQVSFLNGERCKHGTPGSIRVDNFVDGQVAAEMKNYNLTTNVDGLIRDITEQAIKHQQHLPVGTRQIFKIDARGQVLTPELHDRIVTGIVSKTDGILRVTDIEFIGTK